jgi:hypothetical protein
MTKENAERVLAGKRGLASSFIVPSPAKENVMLVSFKSLRSVAVVALLAFGVAACSEGLTAPQTGLDPSSEALFAKGGNGNSGNGSNGGSESGRGRNSGKRTFVIVPGSPVFEKFGDHVLSMPANVVCDPATSGYGSAYWELPCARLARPIEVTAAWSTHSGRPVISFTPHLRFAPSKHQSQWVELSLRDDKGIDPKRNYAILWYDEQARRWVDESQTDPTLKTRTSQSGNLVTRRVKHFSEYALWSGFGSYNGTAGRAGDGSGWGGG